MSMSVTRSVVLLMCAIVHVFLATMKTLGPILWDGPEKKNKNARAISGNHWPSCHLLPKATLKIDLHQRLVASREVHSLWHVFGMN